MFRESCDPYADVEGSYQIPAKARPLGKWQWYIRRHSSQSTLTLVTAGWQAIKWANDESSWNVLVLWHSHGPLARYVKLRVVHAPGMPGTFSSPPLASDPDMHYRTCVTHVPWCMPGSLTSGFLWSRWRGKRSRYSRCMSNRQFYVTGKRPMGASSQDLLNLIRNMCSEIAL